MRPLPCVALVLATFATPSLGQSFDCAKAATATEHAICDSKNLSNLDTEMAALNWSYNQVPMMMGASGDRQDAAKAFQTKRDACGSDTGCLTNAYTARIAQLKSQIETSMHAYCKAIDLC